MVVWWLLLVLAQVNFCEFGQFFWRELGALAPSGGTQMPLRLEIDELGRQIGAKTLSFSED